MTDRIVWRLFVDESGQFGDPADRVSVAGILLRDSPGSTPAALERRLRDAGRGIWPHKASLLNHVSFYAVAAKATGREDSEGPELSDAIRWLAARKPKHFHRAVESLKAQKFPSWILMERLNVVLSEERPEAFAHLRARQRKTRAAVRRVMRDTKGWLVASAEGDREPEYGVVAKRFDSARYLALLDAAVERAAAVVGQAPGVHSLQLWILVRSIVDPSTGEAVAMDRQLLDARFSKLPRPDNVELHPIPKEFDLRENAALFLGDRASNAVRFCLQRIRPNTSLERFESSLLLQLGTPTRSGQPERSHIAANGRTREQLSADSTDRVIAEDELKTDVVYRWAREQAIEWSDA